MATITTDTFLDGGVARTAGEVWINNGGRLTVRTDTRWHANAPASMTGTLGSLTISSSLGGGYTLDGRNVRWMPYNTGSGNVPAIGTTITKNGVSGYFLGVWASLTAAPTAVGAAMPVSGFIKFREVTGGPFTAGALTGIGAAATGPDVVGWIEVVHDQVAAITVPRLGDFTVRGNWFALGTTTGAANQLVQVPTNGSSTCYAPGVWIANIANPLTDEDWDFYPAIYAAGMIPANLGTDARSKFVCLETTGQVRIGHNGTNAVGFVPPAGRAIRIPNVFGRQSLTTARNLNAIPNTTPATRPDFTTTNAGVIDMEYFATDWYMSFAQAYSVRAHHLATFEYFYVSEIAQPLDIYDGGNGITFSADARTFNMTSCFAGGTISKWKCHRHSAGAADHAFEAILCDGQTVNNVEAGILTFVRSSGAAFQLTQCSNLTVNNCKQFNASMFLTTCLDCVVLNTDHCDRYVGATTTITALSVITVNSLCINILVDGVTFGLGGTIASVHPYTSIFQATASFDIKFRNVGTRSAFVNGGVTNGVGYVFTSGGNNQRIKMQRVYVTSTRIGIVSTVNSDKDNTYEHVYGDFADTITHADLNGKMKNCGGTSTVTGQASVYGTHFSDLFNSDTSGRFILAMNEPTAETVPYVTPVSGTPKFTSVGNLVLAVVGDEIIWEMDYWCIGHTALANSLPVITGTNVTFSSGARWGNHDLYFQINKGAGYGGTWIALNQANLALETLITPAVGFKLKIRAVCAIAASTNLLTRIQINTISTLVAQVGNLYPLDTATVTVGGLVSGSRIKATKISDGTVLFNGLESGGTVSFQTDFIGALNIEARKASEAPFYQPWLTQISTIADSETLATALQQLDQ